MMPNGTAAAQLCTTVYFPVPAITWASRSRSISASTGRSRDSPLAVGTSPPATAGRAGSSSWTTSWAPGTRLAISATWAAAPSASEAVRSATAPGIGDGHVERARQLQRGGQRPRPAQLDLERPAEAVERLLHDVQVGGEHGPGAGTRSRPGRSASRQPRGVTSTGMLDQQRGGAAGEVGAGPAVRQLGQVREVGEFPGDDAHRLGRVGPGHRADPGSAPGRPGEAGPVMVIRHMPSLEPPDDKLSSTARRRGPGGRGF